MCEEISEITGISKSTPSTPREFFEKIYGDLDKSNSSTTYSHVERSVQIIEPRITSTSHQNNNWLTHAYFQRYFAQDFNLNRDIVNYPNINIARDVSIHEIQKKITNFNFFNNSSGGSSQLLAQLEPSFIEFPLLVNRRKRKETKPRRQRTTFTRVQTLSLEKEFNTNEYITRSKRYHLSQMLQLTETQIKIWFQNRRAKDKRIEKAQLDHQYRYLYQRTCWMLSSNNSD